MYIYETGLIGKAVRQKIENAKSAAHGGDGSSESFSEVLKSMMTDTNAEPKTVGLYSSGSSSAQPSGDAIIYALRNAELDSTSAAVISSLGLSSYTGIGGTSALETAANELKSSAAGLSALKEADKATALPLLYGFTEKYNSLLTALEVSSSVSAKMYALGLKTAAESNSESLTAAGITERDNGRLDFTAENYEGLELSGFLGSIASSASLISTYASAVSGTSTGLLSAFDDDEGISANYLSLMSSLM
ncbi:MAG: hypothetical protein ACI4KR_13415 [Ruminiclostridium sp.]